jgi:hypothetical protein
MVPHNDLLARCELVSASHSVDTNSNPAIAKPTEAMFSTNYQSLPPLPEEWMRIWLQERRDWEMERKLLLEERSRWQAEEERRSQQFKAKCEEYEAVINHERTLVQNKTQVRTIPPVSIELQLY